LEKGEEGLFQIGRNRERVKESRTDKKKSTSEREGTGRKEPIGDGPYLIVKELPQVYSLNY